MGTPLRVLIIEDRKSDVELIVHKLRRAGFEPIWERVETEADYLAHLGADFDVILTDYFMPQFDAMRALRLLQERGLDIPLIIITGSISEEVAVESMKQGAADYLLKDRLARLGPAVARALEQKRLRDERRRAEEKLQYLSTHDALTDLYNRAFFEEEVARLEWRRQFPVAVVAADLDDLKVTNDSLGHATGDELLRQAAQLFKSVLSAEDVVARIGGDEFAALLPQVDAATLDALLERLRKSLAAYNAARDGPALCLSVGGATAEKGERLAEALKRADERMYRDKKGEKT